jgi:hypothetical protein
MRNVECALLINQVSEITQMMNAAQTADSPELLRNVAVAEFLSSGQQRAPRDR